VPGNELSLFLNLKTGANTFFDQLRLDQMIFDPASEKKYFPVNTGRFSLDISFISNPTNISGVSVLLNFWYCPKNLGTGTDGRNEYMEQQGYPLNRGY